jgi:hypothetical protein
MGLYWPILVYAGHIGLYWFILDYTGLHGPVLAHTGLYLAHIGLY